MQTRITLSVLLLAALVLAVATGRRPSATYLRIEGPAQGTRYHVVWKSPDGRSLKPQVEALLRELDESLSTYRPDSLVSRINRNDTTAVPDDHLRKVLEDARLVHDATGGAFDPTVAPVVRASGFGPHADSEIAAEAIGEALALVGMHQLTITGGRIIKQRPELTLDLNGIAQGYSADVIGRFLASRGITHFLVEVGGEVVAKGVNEDGQDWQVGIDRPGRQIPPGTELHAILPLRDRALATSGNYRASHKSGGRTFTHCIDPRTGEPTQSSLLSATVLAPTCALADAYATACMVMGLAESITLVEARDDLDALFIHTDGSGTFRTHATAGVPVLRPGHETAPAPP